jgi:hypothetical protein
VRPTPPCRQHAQQSALHSTDMTDAASSQPNDSTSEEPSQSAPTVAMGDVASAAAAAALVALPQPAAAAAAAAGEFIDAPR